jgi:hypothetical protein
VALWWFRTGAVAIIEARRSFMLLRCPLIAEVQHFFMRMCVASHIQLLAGSARGCAESLKKRVQEGELSPRGCRQMGSPTASTSILKSLLSRQRSKRG